MVGRIERGDERQFVIGGGQGDQPLSHAAGGSVNGNAKWHGSHESVDSDIGRQCVTS